MPGLQLGGDRELSDPVNRSGLAELIRRRCSCPTELPQVDTHTQDADLNCLCAACTLVLSSGMRRLYCRPDSGCRPYPLRSKDAARRAECRVWSKVSSCLGPIELSPHNWYAVRGPGKLFVALTLLNRHARLAGGPPQGAKLWRRLG